MPEAENEDGHEEGAGAFAPGPSRRRRDLGAEVRTSCALLVEAALLFVEREVDVLHLAVVGEHHLVGLAADAGLLVAAERGVRGQLVVGVDPHAARCGRRGRRAWRG